MWQASLCRTISSMEILRFLKKKTFLVNYGPPIWTTRAFQKTFLNKFWTSGLDNQSSDGGY
jgi:hypothetical protein